MWEHPTRSETALSTQFQQPPTGSHSPYHSYKLCLLSNRRAGSPAVATDKRRPIQASGSLGPTEGGLAYAALVAGRAGPQQQSGPHKPKAKGSDHFEPVASSEEATRHMSLLELSGTLCGMPYGTTSNAEVATSRVAPAGDQQTRRPYTSQGSRTRVLPDVNTGLVSQPAISPD
jgi:hypothetical protein